MTGSDCEIYLSEGGIIQVEVNDLGEPSFNELFGARPETRKIERMVVEPNKTILSISDLHLSGSPFDSFILDSLRETLQNLNPSETVLVLNGDIIDLEIADFFKIEAYTDLCFLLQEYLKLGMQIVYVYGNHDEEDYWESSEKRFYESSGSAKRENDKNYFPPLPVSYACHELQVLFQSGKEGNQYTPIMFSHLHELNPSLADSNDLVIKILSRFKPFRNLAMSAGDLIGIFSDLKEAYSSVIATTQETNRLVNELYGPYGNERKYIIVGGHTHESYASSEQGIFNSGAAAIPNNTVRHLANRDNIAIERTLLEITNRNIRIVNQAVPETEASRLEKLASEALLYLLRHPIIQEANVSLRESNLLQYILKQALVTFDSFRLTTESLRLLFALVRLTNFSGSPYENPPEA